MKTYPVIGAVALVDSKDDLGRAMRKRIFGVFQKVYTSISRRVNDAAADQGIHFLAILRAQPMCFVQLWTVK